MEAPGTFIATITNDERTFEQDMELPSGMPVSELKKQVMMILKETHENIFTDWTTCILESNNRVLRDDDTLLKAGIFDGSMIVVRRLM